jgi:outer membrane protein TolC
MIQAKKYRTHEALVNYKKTIINAVEEVDNAIDSYSAEQKRLQSLSDAREAARRTVTLAQGRYDRGLTDFLNVADAERQLYAIEDQYVQARQAAVLQYIAIYKGLGGGWENYQSIPKIHAPKPAIISGVENAADMMRSGGGDYYMMPSYDAKQN